MQQSYWSTAGWLEGSRQKKTLQNVRDYVREQDPCDGSGCCGPAARRADRWRAH